MRSISLAALHQLDEAVEQIPEIVRTRARLGVALEAERRLVGPGEALQRAVEQRHVRDARGCGKRRRIDGKAVILARDQHVPGVAVEHRVVRAVVAEFHLHRLRARGEAQQLLPEADAERRHAGVDDRADRADRIVAGLRIAGTVRQEDAVRIEREDRIGRRLRRDHGQAAAAHGEHAQDVVLDPVVVGDDVKARLVLVRVPFAQRPRAGRPFVRRGARHDFREIETRHRRCGFRPSDRRVDIDIADRRRRIEATVLRTTLAQDPSELARVDVGDADDLVGGEIRAQITGRPEARDEPRQIADHEPGSVGPARLDVLGIHADVADVRVGERDDLPGVRRIGEDLLVARHRRVEHDFADGVAGGADRRAAKHRAVGKRENRRHSGLDPGQRGGSGGLDGGRGGHDGSRSVWTRRSHGGSPGSGRAKRERPRCPQPFPL